MLITKLALLLKCKMFEKNYKQLEYCNQKLRDNRIPHPALQHPRDSAWQILLKLGNNHSLIKLLFLDYNSFTWLDNFFTPILNDYSLMVDPNGSIDLLKNKKCRPTLIMGNNGQGLFGIEPCVDSYERKLLLSTNTIRHDSKMCKYLFKIWTLTFSKKCCKIKIPHLSDYHHMIQLILVRKRHSFFTKYFMMFSNRST